MLVPWGEIKPDRLVHGDMVNPFNWRIPMGIHQLFLNGLVLMPATDQIGVCGTRGTVKCAESDAFGITHIRQ